MKIKYFFKSVTALIALTLAFLAFFDFGTDFFGRIQPGMSLGFLAVLLLTPLIGRFFCEALCPLGIIQSVVNFIFHPKTKVRRVCTRLPESKSQKIIRWTVFAICISLASFGFFGLAWFLSPYAIFGKSITLFPPALGAAAVVLILAAVGKGRIWCNWICPIGTLFTLLSKFSVSKHKIGNGCGNCKACFSAPKCEKEEENVDGITRRDAVKSLSVAVAAAGVEKTTDGGFAIIAPKQSPKRPMSVLPPGAVDRDEFFLKCSSCGICVSVCRGKCLRPSLSFKNFGQPEMDFRNGYCLTGCNYLCGKVCPTGAIKFLDRLPKANVHMGHAIWKRDCCIRETVKDPCVACIKKCPVKAITLVEGFPVVNKAKCIGCGACEHVCPARPEPAIFVKGFERHRIVKPMAESDLVIEMRSLLDEGYSCVVAVNGVICAKEKGRGIKPLMKIYDSGKLKDAIVVDKIIGRAAAAICIEGKAKKVYASLMSTPASEFLSKHGIENNADKFVSMILNRKFTGSCPMDAAVAEIEEPKKMVAELNKALMKK
jgi:ferredoxin